LNVFKNQVDDFLAKEYSVNSDFHEQACLSNSGRIFLQIASFSLLLKIVQYAKVTLHHSVLILSIF